MQRELYAEIGIYMDLFEEIVRSERQACAAR